MKYHTLRGRITEGVVERLVIDDGRLTHAMKITKFVVAPDVTAAGNDCVASLSTNANFTTLWDFSDNNQIAWAGLTGTGVAAPNQEFSLVDRDHIVVRDLYIFGQVLGAGGTDQINYYIEMEAVEIKEFEAAVALIKERSQGDLR